MILHVACFFKYDYIHCREYICSDDCCNTMYIDVCYTIIYIVLFTIPNFHKIVFLFMYIALLRKKFSRFCFFCFLYRTKYVSFSKYFTFHKSNKAVEEYCFPAQRLIFTSTNVNTILKLGAPHSSCRLHILTFAHYYKESSFNSNSSLDHQRRSLSNSDLNLDSF